MKTKDLIIQRFVQFFPQTCNQPFRQAGQRIRQGGENGLVPFEPRYDKLVLPLTLLVISSLIR